MALRMTRSAGMQTGRPGATSTTRLRTPTESVDVYAGYLRSVSCHASSPRITAKTAAAESQTLRLPGNSTARRERARPGGF